MHGGSVITEGWLAGRSLGEGWHEEFGESHAEIIALRKAGDLAKNATLYVSLEPCSKEGKQPPCTDAILRAGIAKVVFGACDPDSDGAKILRGKGIEVMGPVIEAECRRQNRGFFSLCENGRPWVTIKKALTKDGKIAKKHVTSAEQDRWSHMHLRAMHDAILVGSGTVIADDPQLNVRHTTRHAEQSSSSDALRLRRAPHDSAQDDVDEAESKHVAPRRIILDPHKEIPKDAKVLTDEDADRTLVIHERLEIPDLLEKLKAEGIASVLVEGGPRVWQVFEESGCVDEIVMLISE